MEEFSIPDGLPPPAVARLVELHKELEEGEITAKGYRKHRELILSQYGLSQGGSVSTLPQESSVYGHDRRQSGYESILSYPNSDSPVPHSMMPDGAPNLADLQPPLPPRGIPETANTDPLNVRVRLNMFDNIPSILRYRARTNGEIVAFQCLDQQGKETDYITWGKLGARAEKVAQMLRDQSGTFRGDRVVLMYSYAEVLDFIVAMMGCFLAGLVAVPVSPEHAQMFLQPVLKMAQSKLVLTSEYMLKRFSKQPNFASLQQLATFWKTTGWGSFKGGNLPPLQVPDLAYIEFLRSSMGDLRGVVMSHRTILHQMRCLTALTQSRPEGSGTRKVDRVLCSLDVRRSTGMILGVLLTVYTGNQVFFLNPASMATPGLYAHLASRLRTTILLSDYPALKGVCYNYQVAPNATRNFAKRHDPNLAHIRWCLVDIPTIDPEFLTVLTDRWLKPLGHKSPQSVAAPMLTLTEHGGMVVSTRDYLTPEGGETFEVSVSKEALARNKIEFVSDTDSDSMRLCSFGPPIPDATVAIVDPESCILCQKDTVGEIWIDSPSLSGGFWGHSDDTSSAFHARCFDANGELPQDFLRTGLLGFLKDDRVFVLGNKVDRLLQVSPEPRYYYSYLLLASLMKTVPDIYDGCIFQVPLKISSSEVSASLLNVVLLETPKATGQPTRCNQVLEDKAIQAMAVLREAHKFKVYAVLLCAPGSAPRSIRSGRPDIAKVAARRQFLRGVLPALHIKFDLENAGVNLPKGDDVKGGIWGHAISRIRSHQLELNGGDKQYSGVDMRSNVVDDRIGTSLNSFSSLSELLQWRIQRQPDELAFLSCSSNPSLNRETSWRKFGMRVAAVYHYIRQKLLVTSGSVACLMYTQSEDYVHAVYACFLAGVTVIPFSPLNLDRMDEDVGSLVAVIRQFKVSVLLGNLETHDMMEDKQLNNYLKSNQIKIPKLHNTAKAKISDDMKHLSSIKSPVAASQNHVALIWLVYNADHEYYASSFNHQQLLGMCKIQKETCQMSASKPIIGCVRSVSGLGFLYTACLGVYAGACTILLSPVDYANNPAMFFVNSSRYKVKDGYATQQMLEHAIRQIPHPKGFDLNELQNLVVPLSGRADSALVEQTRATFASVNLNQVALNLAYAPVCNPMATTRSYMLVDNIDQWLDPVALRQGLVSIVNPTNSPQALHLIDSGMVPINTQVAIVNPETHTLSCSGEIGEIWVVSEGNETSHIDQSTNSSTIKLPGGKTPTNVSLLSHSNTHEIADGEPGIKYMRTGDLGFLHTVTKGPGLEMQVLFVTGSLRHTFEVNGLQHFVEDVEQTVINSNKSITECVMAVCGGIVCCIVESDADIRFLGSLSAVVANDIITEHQFAPNIISFVGKNGIPRSRLGEKQRKSLLQLYTGVKRVPLGKQAFRTLMDFTVEPV